MSSPIHHAEDLDEALHYAPPWARESALRHPEQPATAQPVTAQPATEPPQRRRRIGVGPNAFSGDLAMAKLQRQLSLSPDAVPEPPALHDRESLWPIVLRLGGVAGVAAAVAWLIISLPSSRWLHDEIRKADIMRTGALAPAMVATNVKIGDRLDTTEMAAPLLQPQPGTTQQVAEASPALTPPAPTATAASTPPAVATPEPTTETSSNDNAVAPTASLDAGEVATLLKRGKDMLGTGDFAAARLLLRRAAEAGSADAAMALATTFDPLVLHRLGAIGVVPDAARARKWYGKAAALGSTAATQSLSQLEATAQ